MEEVTGEPLYQDRVCGIDMVFRIWWNRRRQNRTNTAGSAAQAKWTVSPSCTLVTIWPSTGRFAGR